MLTELEAAHTSAPHTRDHVCTPGWGGDAAGEALAQKHQDQSLDPQHPSKSKALWLPGNPEPKRWRQRAPGASRLARLARSSSQFSGFTSVENNHSRQCQLQAPCLPACVPTCTQTCISKYVDHGSTKIK